jgi:tetratricopeptide (TPR) repeat protein
MGTVRRHAGAGLLLIALLALAATPREGRPQEEDGTQAEPPLGEQLEGLPPDAQAKYLEYLIESDKETAEVYFYLGNAQYSMGKLEDAKASFERAIELDPDFYKAMVNLALVLEDKGDYQQAEKTYLDAIEVNPGDALAMSHLGSLHYAQGDFERAIDLYRKALEVDPECAQAYYNMGVAFADARIFREAIRLWERVVELDPDGKLGENAGQNVKVLHQYLGE